MIPSFHSMHFCLFQFAEATLFLLACLLSVFLLWLAFAADDDSDEFSACVRELTYVYICVLYIAEAAREGREPQLQLSSTGCL